jgi:DNA-binding NtrC family response regulator
MNSVLHVLPDGIGGEDNIQPSGCFHGMIGTHPLMLELFNKIRAAATLDAPVIVQGETGTGKELVANALAHLSKRRGRLVAINLAEVSDNLIESLLFGSVRGAFTGALDHSGLLEHAADGVLYLDEAGELPLALQTKLLRVIETKQVRRVGSLQERRAEFRLLLSVQSPPEMLVGQGRWRNDFRFRVDGIILTVPPVRERISDVPLLVNHFLTTAGNPALPVQYLADLMAYRWPGNVREIRRVVERARFAAVGSVVQPDHLIQQLPALDNLKEDLTDTHPEREHFETTLQRAGFRSKVAARLLGLSLPTFYRRLKELGIQPPRFRVY